MEERIDCRRRPTQDGGAEEFPIPADHLNQVGWWDPQEAVNPLFGFASVFKQASQYEDMIKDIYLEIAQSQA